MSTSVQGRKICKFEITSGRNTENVKRAIWAEIIGFAPTREHGMAKELENGGSGVLTSEKFENGKLRH